MESLSQKSKTMDVKKLVTLAMLGAMAYLLMVVGRIPIVPSVPFLKYDPKDVVIVIGGFIYGPLAASLISLVVSLLEMITVSETGPIGLIMNVLSTCTFACTAAFIYKRKQSLKGAVTGLMAGVLLTTAVMLIWNYLITPLYMNASREMIAGMLVPAFLPFNLIKGGLNATITMLLYKPVVMLLRRTKLVKASSGGGSIKTGVMLITGLILVTIILYVLILNKII